MTKEKLQFMYNDVLQNLKKVEHPKYDTFRELFKDVTKMFD